MTFCTFVVLYTTCVWVLYIGLKLPVYLSFLCFCPPHTFLSVCLCLRMCMHPCMCLSKCILCPACRQFLVCSNTFFILFYAFGALTLLAWHQEEHPVCKNWVMRCWCSYLSGLWSEVQIVCIWSSWCHCIPKPHHLLPRLNPDWFYLCGTCLLRLSWQMTVVV